MELFAGILLALATLITLLVVSLVVHAHPVGGTDAMGLVVFIPVLFGQWATLAGAVSIAAGSGALGWIRSSPVVRSIAAFVWVGVVGAIASIVLLLAYGPDSDVLVPWAFALSVGVPAMLIVGTAAALFRAPSGTRVVLPWGLGAIAVTMVAASGTLQMLRLEYEAARVRRAAAVIEERERAAWSAARERAFAALPAAAPLRSWLPWLETSEDVRARAIAAVRARPSLEGDVVEMLHSDDAPDALRFMWLWLPEPRSALAAPAHAAIATLPGWAERWLSAPPPAAPSPVGAPDPVPVLRPVDLDDMAQAAIVIADRYESSGLDFDTPIAGFSRVLERHALPEEQLGEDPTYQPRAYLKTWLDGRAAPHRDHD